MKLIVGNGPAYLLVGIVDADGPAETVAESLISRENDEMTDFLHNGIHFYQIRRVTEEIVSFSIIFDLPESGGSGILQFVIPTADAENGTRIVESSFGSVELR